MLRYAALVFLPLIAAIPPWLADHERVVGGTNAKPGEIPYIVSLRSSGSHICGGSILDAYHVLTAAHCTQGTPATYLSIQYGVTKIFTSTNVIKVVKKTEHPEYPGAFIDKDVSVLKLEQPIKFSELAKPVILPHQGEQPPADTWGVLAGWGYPYSGGSVMENLQRVDLIIYHDDDCKAAHGSMVNSLDNVCGGVPEGGKGQCSGDSGGPLVDAGGKQFGVVSWSVKPCTVKGYPGVYARVPSYIDWINKQRA